MDYSETDGDFENPSEVGTTDNHYQTKVGVRDEGDLLDEYWVEVKVHDVQEPVPPTIQPLANEPFTANETFLYHDAVRAG